MTELHEAQDKSHIRLPISLFLLSVGTVLYSLAVFRLISFFIMPSLFFDLLLVCFPIGAALGTRLGQGEAKRQFCKALPVMQVVMLITVVATLTLKHFDYMRENLLFHVDPMRVLVQIGIFALIYSPFFMAYGAAEYLGYVAGRGVLARRMNSVYAVFLFGAAAAFALSLVQPVVGVSRLLVMAIGLVSLAKLAASGRLATGLILELLVLAVALGYPGTDKFFMQWFKSTKPMTVADYKSRVPGTRTLYSGWGKFAYFEVLEQETPYGTVNVGFYNDTSQWLYRRGQGPKDFRDAVLEPFVEGARRAVVIGAGGGRDVKLARDAAVAEIVAIEVEPAVPQVIRGPLREQFDGVYDLPGVQVIVGDARSHLERMKDRFDMIFFWSVGGYPQTMLEPGNMIRTAEALRCFIERLTPRGIFAIGYDAVLDPEQILLRQYATTLSRLGAHLVGFQHGQPAQEYMLLALSPSAGPEELDHWRETIATLSDTVQVIAGESLQEPGFTPVTDDRPYMAGNIRNILTPEQVLFLFFVLGGIVAAFGLASFVSFLRTPTGGPGAAARLLLVSFLLGVNFVLLEHLAVLEIFRRSYVYYDAVMIGMTAFLTLTGAGSFMLRGRWLALAIALGIAVATCLLFALIPATRWGNGLSLLLLTAVTGSMFPTYFEANPQSQLQIFALDAVGGATGALLAFFVPILYGFAAFETLGWVVFIIAGLAMLIGSRRRIASA